jgi:hypothetical protein
MRKGRGQWDEEGLKGEMPGRLAARRPEDVFRPGQHQPFEALSLHGGPQPDHTVPQLLGWKLAIHSGLESGKRNDFMDREHETVLRCRSGDKSVARSAGETGSRICIDLK